MYFPKNMKLYLIIKQYISNPISNRLFPEDTYIVKLLILSVRFQVKSL
jgi:hypothetical protein